MTENTVDVCDPGSCKVGGKVTSRSPVGMDTLKKANKIVTQIREECEYVVGMAARQGQGRRGFNCRIAQRDCRLQKEIIVL